MSIDDRGLQARLRQGPVAPDDLDALVRAALDCADNDDAVAVTCT